MLRKLPSLLVITLTIPVLCIGAALCASNSTSTLSPDVRVGMNRSITIFTIQVFSTRSQQKAEKMVNALQADGLEAYFTVADRNMDLYRVRFGRYQSKKQALTALRKFQDSASEPFQDAFLVQVESLKADDPF